MKVLILYYSKTGHTLEAANATAEGIRSVGSEAKVVSVTEFNSDSFTQYDGVILGSPCLAGSVTGAGVAKPLVRVLDSLPAGSLDNKACGGISVYSTAGGSNTVKALGKILLRKGCKDYQPGPVAKAGVAFSLWKGPSVSPQDEKRFRAYGAQFVGQGS